MKTTAGTDWKEKPLIWVKRHEEERLMPWRNFVTQRMILRWHGNERDHGAIETFRTKTLITMMSVWKGEKEGVGVNLFLMPQCGVFN